MKRQPKQQLRKPSVAVLIAALNEEKNIGVTVKECLTLKQYSLTPYVVLDSKTTDNTASVAKKAGAEIIQTGSWKGKGAALRLALPKIKEEYSIMIDADYQFLPRDIPKLVEPLRNGIDVTLGTRYRKGANVHKGSVTKLRRFGIHFLSLSTSVFSGQYVSDVLAGFKGFKTPVLKNLHMEENHYGYEAEVVIRAAQKGYTIRDIPIEYRKRHFGSSNVIPFKHGFMFLWTIIRIGMNLS